VSAKEPLVSLTCRWRGLARATCVLLALSAPARAAQIQVDAGCSLAQAIEAANSNGTVSGSSCEAGDGADRIVLTETLILDTRYYEFLGWNAAEPIISEITLDGRGYWILRDGAGDDFRFFIVHGLGKLTLEDVTLAGGKEVRGGAVYNLGELYLKDDSALYNSDASLYGGGLYNSGTAGFEDSWVTLNHSDLYGGGIYNQYGTVSLVRSALLFNDALAGGGAFNSSGGDLLLSVCRLENNEGSPGGAILNEDYLFVAASLFYDNSAASSGGGAIFNNDPDGDAYIVDSTFSKNSAVNGGAIRNMATLTAELSTFSGNESTGPAATTQAGFSADLGSSSSLGSSIIVNSLGGGHCNTGSILDLTGNLGCHGDEVTNFDVFLRDNGGPTFTHALGSDSSNAVDAAGSCGIGVDQRGISRTGLCDSGAFEYGACEDGVLRDRDVVLVSIWQICEHLWIGPAVEVQTGGQLVARAGATIRLRDGFSVAAGGLFTAEIDSTLLPP